MNHPLPSAPAALLSVVVLCSVRLASSENAIVPGEFLVERPTLHCLGFRWYVSGDENRNATTTVSYRPKGSEKWIDALPLLRIPSGTAGTKDLEWKVPNLFAGSILDLQAGAAYEVKLALVDPDGGAATTNLAVTTRSVPVANKGGKTLHARPPSLQAIYDEAQPGDVILIHAGTYTGSYTFTKKATADKPIVFRAAGDGEVVFDGEENDFLFNCVAADYHFFEGLTLQNAQTLIFAGKQAGGCSGLVVRDCRLRRCTYGVFNNFQGARDFYIADNVFEGPLTIDWSDYSFKGKFPGGEPDAIWWAGSGHVICYNRFTRWWDAIHGGGGRPGNDRATLSSAIDVYNNEISSCSGDAAELDYGVHNIRVFRNRILNCYAGISSQPTYGGPAYIFRNEIVNIHRYGIKLQQATTGVLVYHNTILMGGEEAVVTGNDWRNLHVHNNLFLGTDAGERGLIWNGTATPETCRIDHNGWREKKNNRFYWQFPTERVSSGGSMSKEDAFTTLREWSEATGFEKHGTSVDYGVFLNATMVSGTNTPSTMDLRLKPKSAAVDAGTPLPNINDGFLDKAPDFGAHELNQSVPHYGPRSKASQ